MPIPFELMQLPQWAVSTMDGSPQGKAPRRPGTLSLLAVDKPQEFATYEQCKGHAHKGIVLTEDDPYTVIDLDDPKSDEERERHSKIYNAFQSYAEISSSGKGVHIICKGSVPCGLKRSNVEVYSSKRYIICTGNTCRDMPITNCQELLDILYSEMRISESVKVPLHELPERFSDSSVVEIARNATNGAKFDALCNGVWEGEYPSQSEADLALLAILCYYSPSNEQVRRIFRLSGLGQRDKAIKNDTYLDFCLRRIRGNQLPLPAEPEPEQPVQKVEPMQKKSGFSYPPGKVGELAQYITNSNIRPVPVIGTAAAIALCAGMAGRCFNISGTGLNQYIMVLAATGTGKEGAASGIERVMAQLRPQLPGIDEFQGPGAFSSGQAMIRVLSEKPCFVSVLGEFGLTLQRLSSKKAIGAEITFKQALLDLYQKSGWQCVLRSSAYSDKEKSTAIVQAPAFTILGESTQESLLDNLTPSLISDGLLPRFCIMEHTEGRPKRNLHAFKMMDAALLTHIQSFALTCLSMKANNSCLTVQCDAEAQKVLDDFDEKCDDKINSSDEVFRQLWNRAHLKALKLAALLAVVDGYTAPIVRKEAAMWAVEFVENDIEIIASRFESDKVGDTDDTRLALLKDAIRAYKSMLPQDRISGYSITEKVAEAGNIVPYTFLRQRLRMQKAFTQHPLGVKRAIEETLLDGVNNGLLDELSKLECRQEYGARTRLFAI